MDIKTDKKELGQYLERITSALDELKRSLIARDFYIPDEHFIEVVENQHIVQLIERLQEVVNRTVDPHCFLAQNIIDFGERIQLSINKSVLLPESKRDLFTDTRAKAEVSFYLELFGGDTPGIFDLDELKQSQIIY